MKKKFISPKHIRSGQVSPKHSGGGKRFIVLSLTMLFVLSFFSFGLPKEAKAETITLKEINFTSGQVNDFDEKEKNDIGLKCKNDYSARSSMNPNDETARYNNSITCTWNPLVANYNTYHVVYTVGANIITGSATQRTNAPPKKDPPQTSENKIQLSKGELDFISDFPTDPDNAEKGAEKIYFSAKVTKIVKDDTGKEKVPTDADIDFISEKYFSEGKNFELTISSPEKIILSGSSKTEIPRPDITFDFSDYAKQRGGGVNDLNIFYYKAKTLNNLYIRIYHTEANDSPKDPDECYNASINTNYAVSFVDGIKNAKRMEGITLSLGNTFFNGFFNKLYNDETTKKLIGSGKTICPKVAFISDEETKNAGAKLRSSDEVDTAPDQSTIVPISKADADAGAGISGENWKCKDMSGDQNFMDAFNNNTEESRGVFTYMICWGLDGVRNLAEIINTWLVGRLEAVLIVGGVTKNNIVIEIWKMIRNVVNILFLIAFLIMALANIFDALGMSGSLKLDAWKINKMIPTIVISVLLVNFSLAISNFLLDLANSLTKFFMEGTTSLIKSGDLSSIAGPILGAIFTAFTYLAYAIVLLYIYLVMWVRVIVLNILFMFAGVPYIANVLPVKQVQDITGKWWGEFTKWLFMGPLIALFIYITIFAMRTPISEEQLPRLTIPESTAPKATTTTKTTPSVCGDGKTEGDEQCDDTNKTDGDGCSATCKDETTATPPPAPASGAAP